MARLLIWCFVWIQVHLSKRAALGSPFFGAMGTKARKWLSRRDVPTSRCSNVATFQRRDVPTSRRPSVTTLSQQCISQQVKNVATSQRRDFTTSRRQLEICNSSFKVRMAQKSGHRETYERRHGIPEQSDTDFEEVAEICTVFNSKHFHLFIQYVLDLFLGLY